MVEGGGGGGGGVTTIARGGAGIDSQGYWKLSHDV